MENIDATSLIYDPDGKSFLPLKLQTLLQYALNVGLEIKHEIESIDENLIYQLSCGVYHFKIYLKFSF